MRKVGKALGLPAELFDRIPFPGPGLAARVIGEVRPERVEIARQANTIAERYLENRGAFQYMAILHEDRVTGMVDGKREFGMQIEIRCWDSIDARVATPTEVPFDVLKKMAVEITDSIPGVVSVIYDITCNPRSTIEAI